MKILCISDTHGLHLSTPKEWFVEADMIIHAGDCTNRGSIPEIEMFLVWFNKLPYKHKIFIAGNHDWDFERYPKLIKKSLKLFPGITYLQDKGVEIEGIKFWGSPQTPYFYNWAFNCARNEEEVGCYRKPLIKDYWSKIPKDTNILITHGPVHEILDYVPYKGGEFTGCKELKETILTLPDLKTHISGHIHCGYGEEFHNGVHYVNAACCTERYEPINKPILIEI